MNLTQTLITACKQNQTLRYVRDLSVFGSSINHICLWILKSNIRREHSPFYPTSNFYRSFTGRLLINLSSLFFPFVNQLIKRGYRVSINNISNAPGHIYPEIDWIYRRLRNEPEIKIVLFVYPRNPILAFFARNLSSKKLKIIDSLLYHIFFYSLALRFPELSIDCSLRAQNDLGSRRSFREVTEDRYCPYYQERRRFNDFYPLKKDLTYAEGPLKFLNLGEYVVVQIKDQRVNANYNPIVPNTLLKTLHYASSLGLKIVFAGREKMPECFESFDVFNYSESDLASAENDYILVRNSKLVISSASGFSFIPDCLDIPVLSLNNIHLCAYPGRKTIELPAKVFRRGQPMGFFEQYIYTIEFGNLNPNLKYEAGVDVIDADEELIFDAFLELLNICNSPFIPPLNPSQQRFFDLFTGRYPSLQQGRIANAFLAKYPESFF